MRHFALWIIAGLLGAGLVHGASILLIPSLAPKTAYQRLADRDADGRFAILPTVGSDPVLPFLDPTFVNAACRFDLDRGPVRVLAPLPATFATLTFYGRSGQIFYSLTDRAAQRGSVSVVLLNDRQNDIPDGGAGAAAGEPQALRIVSPSREGFIVLRMHVPSRGASRDMQTLAQTARCDTVPQN
jgi:uncharacterized membrane protein